MAIGEAGGRILCNTREGDGNNFSVGAKRLQSDRLFQLRPDVGRLACHRLFKAVDGFLPAVQPRGDPARLKQAPARIVGRYQQLIENTLGFPVLAAFEELITDLLKIARIGHRQSGRGRSCAKSVACGPAVHSRYPSSETLRKSTVG